MRTSGKAIASLTLGLLLNFLCFSAVPAIFLGLQALRDIAESRGRLRGRGMAITGIVLGVAGCLLMLASLMTTMWWGTEGSRRSQCLSNLKLISIALYNYNDVNGSLPPAAIIDKQGRPLLSWRVAILPYLESGELYSKFHLDEPWDSPHNRSLLDAMPPCFACPSARTLESGMTGYQAVIGPDTAFTPNFEPLRFEDFTDSLADTLLIGESRRGVPWTKPEDLPFDMTKPLTGLGSDHGRRNNGFFTSFADGSVHFLKNTIPPSVLGAILTRNANEVVAPNSY